jgi:hypothetical protein
MRRWLKAWFATGLGLVFLAGGCAGAAKNVQPPRVVAINATDPRPSQVDDRNLTPAETLELINEDATLVEHQLIRARNMHDAERAACLNDTLSELHADGRNAGDQAQALKTATEKNDAVRVREHRVMLDVLRHRAERLTRQADRCGSPAGGAAVARPDPLTVVLSRDRTSMR